MFAAGNNLPLLDMTLPKQKRFLKLYCFIGSNATFPLLFGDKNMQPLQIGTLSSVIHWVGKIEVIGV